MKFAAVVLPLVPAALAAECVRDSGCAGCGQVASVSYVQNGNIFTATAPSYGSVTFDAKTITVKNTSNKWLLFCNWGSACFPLEAGQTCTTSRQSSDSTSLGLQVSSK
ncbi:hypothetical protein CORC01_03505 [Colletotrichum orchidophilum]|uniref:Uncharacterized protein n=1 Tax=Colletotrichum orchidophilum TaxID=1209926 RepID=A0A1G4BI77_9PEZI|nr:uncharacterized protein CORC01_03505 [Colletotrichum orchidophilum]OHF01190.1 hypothetical protein CORC01_03505 [Colletotrichum orchidophilum]